MIVIEALRRLIGLAWLMGYLAGATTTADEPDVPEPTETGLTGKAVYLKTSDGSVFLEDVATRRLGGRTFVTGRVFDPSGRSAPEIGLRCWQAVDGVEKMIEFQDAAAARKFCADKARAENASAAGRSTSSKAAATDPEVTEVKVPTFAIPFRTDPTQAAGLAKLRLFVSRDGGRSWSLFGEYAPEVPEVRYWAEEDGVYWFALQVAYRSGREEPADPKDFVPGQKVRVNCGQKPSARRPEGTP